MALHPDRGGDPEKFKQMFREYQELLRAGAFKKYSDSDDCATKEEKSTEMKFSAAYVRVLNELLKYPDLTVELCGSWLWISGKTRERKEVLKAVGCRWSRSKGCWYFRPDDKKSFGHRKGQTMAKIREKYGSRRIRRAYYPAVIKKDKKDKKE